ncbi:MAG: hypothetical protein ISS63_05855 [Desulfobacteraceae bacterium]|nr:hypothetical protein [Desulfobacteraceae bacterium]
MSVHMHEDDLNQTVDDIINNLPLEERAIIANMDDMGIEGLQEGPRRYIIE